jgi:hypothetical protein
MTKEFVHRTGVYTESNGKRFPIIGIRALTIASIAAVAQWIRTISGSQQPTQDFSGEKDRHDDRDRTKAIEQATGRDQEN